MKFAQSEIATLKNKVLSKTLLVTVPGREPKLNPQLTETKPKVVGLVDPVEDKPLQKVNSLALKCSSYIQ